MTATAMRSEVATEAYIVCVCVCEVDVDGEGREMEK
jgi:hypothetical protein